MHTDCNGFTILNKCEGCRASRHKPSFNPSAWVTEAGQSLCELEGSLLSSVGSRLVITVSLELVSVSSTREGWAVEGTVNPQDCSQVYKQECFHVYADRH